jgi:hypothetical protein
VRKAPIKAAAVCGAHCIGVLGGRRDLRGVVVFITGPGTRSIWRCTSRSRGSSAAGRSIGSRALPLPAPQTPEQELQRRGSLWPTSCSEPALAPTTGDLLFPGAIGTVNRSRPKFFRTDLRPSVLVRPALRLDLIAHLQGLQHLGGCLELMRLAVAADAPSRVLCWRSIFVTSPRDHLGSLLRCRRSARRCDGCPARGQTRGRSLRKPRFLMAPP